MADPQRLNELRKQRELIAAHLQWLDAQIAATGASPSTNEAFEPPPQGPASAPTRIALQPTPQSPRIAAADPDALLEELVEETDDPGAQLSKTGCWITFATIMLVVSGLSIWAIYSFWG